MCGDDEEVGAMKRHYYEHALIKHMIQAEPGWCQVWWWCANKESDAPVVHIERERVIAWAAFTREDESNPNDAARDYDIVDGLIANRPADCGEIDTAMYHGFTGDLNRQHLMFEHESNKIPDDELIKIALHDIEFDKNLKTKKDNTK
jgi:hypothetical protein